MATHNCPDENPWHRMRRGAYVSRLKRAGISADISDGDEREQTPHKWVLWLYWFTNVVFQPMSFKITLCFKTVYQIRTLKLTLLAFWPCSTWFHLRHERTLSSKLLQSLGLTRPPRPQILSWNILRTISIKENDCHQWRSPSRRRLPHLTWTMLMDSRQLGHGMHQCHLKRTRMWQRKVELTMAPGPNRPGEGLLWLRVAVHMLPRWKEIVAARMLSKGNQSKHLWHSILVYHSLGVRWENGPKSWESLAVSWSGAWAWRDPNDFLDSAATRTKRSLNSSFFVVIVPVIVSLFSRRWSADCLLECWGSGL